MGNRAHLIIKPEHYRADEPPPAPIFLYVHWLHAELPVIIKGALARSRSRWDDPTYLTRIVVSDIFAAAGIDSLTGAGLSTEYMESPREDDITLDLTARAVHIGERSWTYESFVATPDAELYR